ncbi:hypothetical protein BD289DRAFT_96066 [Coniella lustricola]|uniref:Uncharacterized protein n=1 Tax=Coniella lustricola TaxID=2025994 RepID=A0A2T2ZY25_9PEZI|nr:hypothetical protein BD289DRAFT_96066 [Coniella lustricola]
MCSSGSHGWTRCTSVRPAAYDNRKMKKLRDAGPGREKWKECSCPTYLEAISRKDPGQEPPSRIKSEEAEQEPMSRLPSRSPPSSPRAMQTALRHVSQSQRSTSPRIKYDLSSDGDSTSDESDSESYVSDFRPSKSPSRLACTAPSTTRSQSAVRGENMSVQIFAELPRPRMTFTIPIRAANKTMAPNSTSHSSPASLSASGSSSSGPKKQKHRSSKRNKGVSRENRAPTNGMFSPPPTSDVDDDIPAARSPKGKSKSARNGSRNGRAKSKGVEKFRGRMLERNPNDSRTRSRPHDSPRTDNCRVKKKRHKTSEERRTHRERKRDRLAREARTEPSIEETPASRMLNPDADSSPMVPAFSSPPPFPNSPIPPRYMAPIVEPATPGPSRSRSIEGAMETPDSHCSLFVTQARKRSAGKRTHDDFTTAAKFTVKSKSTVIDSMMEDFEQRFRPWFSQVVDKTEAVRTETDGLKKRVKKTESDLSTFSARLDAQTSQVRTVQQKSTQIETRVQTLEQQVAAGHLDECRRENQELRDTVNNLRQQQEEDSKRLEVRIKKEIEEVKADFATLRAEQEEGRRLDKEQQAVADHERTKEFRDKHYELSQSFDNAIRVEREARAHQAEQFNDKIAAWPAPVRSPALDPLPPRRPQPYIPVIQPQEFYRSSRPNGIHPHPPATIPDTLVRPQFRPPRARQSQLQPQQSGRGRPASNYSANQLPPRPSSQPRVNRSSARPEMQSSRGQAHQSPARPTTQPPPPTHAAQLPSRPCLQTHNRQAHQSPRRRQSRSPPGAGTNFTAINKEPKPSCSHFDGAGPASHLRVH